MKYLVFDWNKCGDISDLTEISDIEFEELAEKHGKVYTNYNDFVSDFNAERISTNTHQLRITEGE